MFALYHFHSPWRYPAIFLRKGKTVEIIGLNDSSAERHGRLTGGLPSR